jgi:hypothetical protein
MKQRQLWNDTNAYSSAIRRTLGQTYGIKTRCYWEHDWGTHWEPREYIWKMMGTHWELEREHVGNKGKMKKIPFYPNLKRKKINAF